MRPEDWLAILSQPHYSWKGMQEPPTGATSRELEKLTAWFGRPLPEDYTAFLQFTNGASIESSTYGTLLICSVDEVSRIAEEYGITSETLSGAIPFAGDGGGEILVFDVRPERPDGRYPIYSIDPVSLYRGWEYAIYVADSFLDLVQLRTDLLHNSK